MFVDGIGVVVVLLGRGWQIGKVLLKSDHGFSSTLYMENFPHGPQGSVLRGKYCYIEFLLEHSLMFSDVLHSHMTSSHPFHPTCPFKILTSSGFHSLSTAFPHPHHIHHINHGHNMPGLSWNHLGIFQAVTKRH